MKSFAMLCWAASAFIGVLPLTAQTRAVEPAVLAAEIAKRYRVESLEYPDTPFGPINVAVAPNGIAVVPVGGGLFLAGLGGWLVDPKPDSILSASYDATGNLITASRTPSGAIDVLRTMPGHLTERIAQLPSGRYSILDAGDSQVLVAGRMTSGDWIAWMLRPSTAPRVLIQTKERIPAATVLNRDAVVLAIGSRIVILRRGKSPLQLARSTRPIDGLTTDPKGTLYLSNDQGVFRAEKMGELTMIARGVHGPLIQRAGALYVLSRNEHRVLVLRQVREGGRSAP